MRSLIADVVDGDCTASGKGNEKKRQGQYGFIKSGSDDEDEDGSPEGGARRVISEERNDLSIKFDVKVERCSRGSGVSKDAIMGVRKCYKTNLNIMAEDKRCKNSLNKPGPTHLYMPSQYRRIHGLLSFSSCLQASESYSCLFLAQYSWVYSSWLQNRKE